ncbi:MAG: SDR family NAD(P)-dependent oxidoreductase, partial [Maritimibacter sp.]|nr:SDR family NAD(P)-dependent oxidoreductase [Maritimibacter sp.]
SDRAQLEALRDRVDADFGGADLVMNNAAIQPGSALFGSPESWARILDVNLWGVIHGAQVFAPGLIGRGKPGAIVNTGSKQGITSPPGDPAYNVAKSGVKTFTELLAHEIRGQDPLVTTHLLIPGFTFTELTRGERVEKPAGAWEPGQVADFLVEGMGANDFYILCPDNDVTREVDAKRMEWAMGDIIHNRPPLSRWHPDWGEKFAAFLRDG